MEACSLSELEPVDLVSQYRFLKKHIYSMADHLDSRPAEERYHFGRLIGQPFSEKLALYNAMRHPQARATPQDMRFVLLFCGA